MGATNKILSKRVDELTEALTEARSDMLEAVESGDVEPLIQSCSDIDEMVGPEEDDENLNDESHEEGSDEEGSAEEE